MEAIRRHAGRHSVIVLATGRDMDKPLQRGPYQDMLIRPDAIVHLNGTKVTVGEQVIFEHFFSKETLRELLTYCDAAGYGMGITVGWEDFYTHPEVISAMDLTRWGRSDRDFKDWRKLLEMPVRTLAFVGNEEQAKDLERRFPQLNFPMFAGKTGADVIEKGMSKAEGLIRLSRYFGEKEDLSAAHRLRRQHERLRDYPGCRHRRRHGKCHRGAENRRRLRDRRHRPGRRLQGMPAFWTDLGFLFPILVI